MILLRTHSQFSFHRATASIDELVGAAVASGMSHLALTDYFGLFGAVRFVQACKRAGVKPILGMMTRVQLAASGRPETLTLLAKSSRGYQSLCELSTIHQTEADTQSRGIEWERFLELAKEEGLICIVGGHGSLFEHESNPNVADLWPLGDLFGQDGYMAVDGPADGTADGTAGQPYVQDWVTAGESCGMAPVLVRPVFHVNPADRDLFRLLKAIDENIRLEDVKAEDLPHRDDVALDVGWPDDFSQRLSQMGTDGVLQQAVANTAVIAEKCGDCLPDGRPLWPVLDLPEGRTAAEELRWQAQNNLHNLYEVVTPKIEARLTAELDLITQHSFEPLFLILAEVITFVRANRILMGSRGSVANSLVAYCLGISLVDPIKYDLLFERFLNPERKSLPDIDLDFESRNGRDRVLDFIRQRYGEHRVALVSTVNSYRKRSAVRECAKAYGMSSAEIKLLSKQLPSSWRHPDPERRGKTAAEAILEIASNPYEKKILGMAVRIIDFPSHMGLHPGGIVVSPPEKMTDHCPLFLSPKGFLATQFDFRDVETLGLIKMDVLGIRALTVIEIALELINSGVSSVVRVDAAGADVPSKNERINRRRRLLQIEDIPLEDEATGDLIERGETIGVFQAESTGSQRTLRQLRARDPWGLALANAFFKPGPATGGQAKNFIRRIRGEEVVAYLHPSLEPVLSKTMGVLVFQEDVLRICTEVGKLTWTEANSIRKGMSKFEGGRIRELRERFVSGAISGSGVSNEVAQLVWDQIEAFAGYGFNAGHALSYALPTFQMAWLKCHYPAEFMTARLRAGGGYYHPAVNVAEARRLGIAVRGPHVNYSESVFSVSVASDQYAGSHTDHRSPATGPQATIFTGLGWVKELRRTTVQAIVLERKYSPYANFDDFAQRIQCGDKELKHLIQCGALDGLGVSRKGMLAQSKTQTHGQMALFGSEIASGDMEPDGVEEKLRWELDILGMPFNVRPTELLEVMVMKGERPAAGEIVPVKELAETNGKTVHTLGWRLPGHTGGKGFYISDGVGLVLAWDKGAQSGRSAKSIKAWVAVIVKGAWRVDRFGGGWFQVEKMG